MTALSTKGIKLKRTKFIYNRSLDVIITDINCVYVCVFGQEFPKQDENKGAEG